MGLRYASQAPFVIVYYVGGVEVTWQLFSIV